MRSFGIGLVEGLATSTTKSVNDAMNDLDGRISRLSEKKINRQINEKSRFDKEFQGNEQQVKYYANQLNINGGTDGMRILHSLINTESWAGAQVEIPKIVKKLTLNGMDATNYLTKGKGLTDLEGKKLPNSKSLAELITFPMSSNEMDMEKALEGSGSNILNIFSRGNDSVAKYAQKRVNTNMALAGVSNTKTNYGELPAAENIKIDKFDLLLGDSYAKDLKIITARLNTLDPVKNAEEIKKLKVTQDFASTIIRNTGDKAITLSQEKSAASTFSFQVGLALNIKQSMVNGDWNTLDAKSEGGKIAARTGILNAGHLKWAKSTGRASVNDKKNPNAVARGFISETFKDRMKEGSDIRYDTAMEPNQFLLHASANLFRVKRITKQMIIDDESGTYKAVNNGNPYLTFGEQIKRPKNNPTKLVDKVFGANTSTTSEGEILDKLKANWLKAGNQTSSQAQKYKTFFNRYYPNMTDANRKGIFLQQTGSDWKDTYGAIK
tara:strand:- start:3655 stop:5139 length:1485 start_codon:yes stop_codon:yes gene_type:complete